MHQKKLQLRPRKRKQTTKKINVAYLQLISIVVVLSYVSISFLFVSQRPSHNEANVERNPKVIKNPIRINKKSNATSANNRKNPSIEKRSGEPHPIIINSNCDIPPHGYAGQIIQHDFESSVKFRVPVVPSTLGDTKWETGCLVSHKYKFAYFHVLKSGGTTIKAFLKNGLCPTFDTKKNLCPTNKSLIKIESCSSAAKLGPDYFKWSFVRNPFSRMWSIYSMGIGGFRRYGNGNVDTSFESFVTSEKRRIEITRMSPFHWKNQHLYLFDRNHCPALNFLGRLEEFDRDMQLVLNHIQSQELIDFYENGAKKDGDETGNTVEKVDVKNTWGQSGRDKNGGDLRAIYFKNNRGDELMKKIEKEFELDFKLLGYDVSVVPSQ